MRFDEQPLEQAKFLKSNPTDIEPWATLMKTNSVELGPNGVPMFVAQGTDDPIVPPEIIEAFVRKICESGTQVDLLTLEGAGHAFAAYDSASTAVAWIADRFEGKPVPDDCSNRENALHP